MPTISGTLLVGLSLLGASPAGKWIGQDGHDVVGPSSEVKPSDVQDLHILLGNLPPSEIVAVQVMGEGGDEWVHPSKGSWAAGLERKPGARTADLFLEPTRVEKGRSFQIRIRFDDGSTADFYVRGGKADPNLRMPGAALSVKWTGQDRQDWVGTDLGVGPDGLQDVRLALSKLSPKEKVLSVELRSTAGLIACSGVNPKGAPNAELIRSEKDRTQAEFFFQPSTDLNGKSLKLIVSYENGKSDSAVITGGKLDAKLKMPRVALPTLSAVELKAEWLGQDGAQDAGPGTVHIALSGLPSRHVAGMVLGDALRGNWQFRENDQVRIEGEPTTKPLIVRRAGGSARADLYFSPYRDETGTTMTVRLVYQDGTMAVAQFPGGRANPALCAHVPAAATATAKPGDNLQELVDRNGTVRLAKGTYVLTRPLVLGQPVNLVGEPGAVLMFEQPASDPPWTTAVKIHRGGTTLDGFAIRFRGPVRWDEKVNWGPAIIGGTDNRDSVPGELKRYLTFRNLDIESPPAADPKAWVAAPRLMRLEGTAAGSIVHNTLRGGIIEFFNGPWLVEANDYRGTPVGTFSDAFVAAHDPNDLVIVGNRVQPVAPCGKSWRFLVMTGNGARDRIENNTVVGVGAREDDTIPWSNAPEIMLTEAYQVLFEGKPSALSADGRVLRIGRSFVHVPHTGDVVAVLSGKSAGQWRKIAQAINGTTFLLDQPLPDGAEVVSIVSGFVDDVIQRNTIDGAGAYRSTCFQFSGSYFGLRLEQNRFAGTGFGGQVFACATEAPLFWGWTHTTFLDAVVAGNVFEDTDKGLLFEVMHDKPIKSNRGRVYMTISVQDNTVRWSDTFLASRHSQAGGKPLPPGLTIGSSAALDPTELHASARDNRLQAAGNVGSAGPLVVGSALFNGQTVVKKSFSLAPAKDTTTGGRSER